MVDVVLIQPSVLRRIDREEPRIIAYFEAMSHVGSLLGDSPLEPNYGLLAIAQALRESGVLVEFIDFTFHDLRLRSSGHRLTDEAVEEILVQHPGKIYGMSFMTPTYGVWAKILARILHKVAPTSYQVVGGIHPSMCADQVLKDCPEIDFVVEGEAERIVSPLFKSILEGSPPVSMPCVRGRKRQEGGGYGLLTREVLDHAPYPAYDLALKQNPNLIPRIYSGRGCSRRCNFCVVSNFFSSSRDTQGRYHREIAIDVFKRQLRHMLTVYTPKFFCLGDLTFAHNREHALELCRIITEIRDELGIGTKWWAQTCANLVDVELARAMQSAGCCQIAIGIEGGQDAQRKRVVKNLTTKRATDSLMILRDLGLEIQTYWIIGLPKDDESCVAATIDLMVDYLERELTHLTHISVLVPYPGTSLRRHPEQLGIRLDSKRAADLSLYWMNCDPYGCGIPVYSTIDDHGNILLSAERIYELWLEALAQAESIYRSRTSGPGISTRSDPRVMLNSDLGSS